MNSDRPASDPTSAHGPSDPTSAHRPSEPPTADGPSEPPTADERADDHADRGGAGPGRSAPPSERGGAGPGRSAPATEGDDTDAGAGGPGQQPPPSPHAVAVARPGAAPPRPPRRTGVFLDPEDLRQHVGALLRTILGGYEVDAFGNYTFTHEGARVFVTVDGSPIGPQVGVFSVTNLDIELSPDLAAFLVTTNHTLGFGAFSYDPTNRAVWLRHSLLGTTLDGPELQSAVASVATTAARLDQPIRDRFGGGTFADAPKDVQRGVEPPHVDPEPPAPNASGYL